MKNSKNYVMSPTATLTQSGLLAVLLQRQRQKAIELRRHGTRREQRGSGRLFSRRFARNVLRHT